MGWEIQQGTIEWTFVHKYKRISKYAAVQYKSYVWENAFFITYRQFAFIKRKAEILVIYSNTF
jgi:hypothetical protein